MSGFNSLLSAFRGVNLTIGVREDYFKDKYKYIKESMTQNLEVTKRGLGSGNILNDLKQVRYESFVLEKLMVTHGYRINEAMKIVHDSQRYLKILPNGTYMITGVSGKGGKSRL